MDELVQSVTDNCPQPWRGCGAGSGIYGAANLAIRLRMSSRTQLIHELRNRVRYINQFSYSSCPTITAAGRPCFGDWGSAAARLRQLRSGGSLADCDRRSCDKSVLRFGLVFWAEWADNDSGR